MLTKVPVQHPKPDANEFIDIMLGRVQSGRVPLVEYIVDDAIMKPILTDLLNREWVDPAAERDQQAKYLDNLIEFWYRMGYDFVRFEQPLPFRKKQQFARDTGSGGGKQRVWVDLHQGNIMSWEDFETYPWPKMEQMDFWQLEYINAHLPEGMGFITCHAAGIVEHVSQLMSYEGLCFALFDEPELVKAVADKVGALIYEFYQHLLDLDNVIAIFQGDDMGFRTGTLISPDDLRRYFLPWHRQFAELVHQHNRPYFLHSCGDLSAIYDDLIYEVKIDGKHSFEDLILPVEKFQEMYGDKIAVLGGVDINLLSTGTTDAIRKRTRYLIETCGARGRYAVGSGNSIPSYIPVENYLVMVGEVVG